MDDGIYEWKLLYRPAVEKGEWREGLPPDVSIDDVCEAIKKIAKERDQARSRLRREDRT